MKKIIILLFSLCFINFAEASGGHADEHAHPEVERGPKGGLLLEKEELTLELLLVKIGASSEMHLFAYDQDNESIDPKKLRVNLHLTRLGNKVQKLTLKPENDYLLATDVFAPHSYEIKVKAFYKGRLYKWQTEDIQHRTHLSARQIEQAQIKTEKVSAGVLNIKESLFGKIEAPLDATYLVQSPYASTLEKLYVTLGDKVKKGQPLARLKNIRSLQTYTLKATASGEISDMYARLGQRIDTQPLLQISHLDKVWLNLSAFPAALEKMAVGQDVKVYDLHNHQQVDGKISYVSALMSKGHIAHAQAILPNKNRHWRPGMHVKAEVIVELKSVPLLIKKSALQRLEDQQIVFVKVGDEFEARFVVLGTSDSDSVEVISGLSAGEEYVSQNSFLLKADVLKTTATHSH